MSMETKTVLLSGYELCAQDREAVSEMVHDALRDMGVYTESFSWSIEVAYTVTEQV